jgi:8-oxo-dGTP pyrophosphatase MutT (NUDIX family)
MDAEAWIARLEKALSAPLPGPAAWQKMAPSQRRTVSVHLPKKSGGVLMLLYPHHGRLHCVFMRRAEYDGVHSGQVSFPGGMKEEHDASMTDTALREAQEEIGIDPARVRVLGVLTPLHIPVSNIVVYPTVGYVPERPVFRIDPEEVQYLIEESLDTLADAAILKSEKMVIQDKEMDVPYFDVQGHHIWGATAMILSEFLEVYSPSPSGEGSGG